MDYDFGGWATYNNLLCADGRTIRKDAFIDNDGQSVPLVWNHQHNSPDNVLGHAMLKNREDGVYAYCSFNDSESGQNAKLLVEHGDICSLSILANQLKEQAGNVLHGMIREVSLVIAGANPGAMIDTVMAHADGTDNEAIIYTGMPLFLCHSDEQKDDEEKKKDGEESKETNEDETIEDVFDTLTEKQKTVVYAIVGGIMDTGSDDEDEKKDNNEGGETMKHNVFDNEQQTQEDVLSHAAQMSIIEMAKKPQVGSFKEALKIYIEENSLQHDALSSGIATSDISKLFPEYQEVRPGAPELITNDQGWISVIMRKVHKSPISRIRTTQADIRKIDSLRAKGYQKGKQKKLSGNFNLVRRTTDPQTVYVKSALNRDDIIDIIDFDLVQYLYNIDRMQLNEELAVAMMLGDGRDEGAEDKIAEDKIRPIWTDDELYTIHVDLDLDAAKTELQGTSTGANFGENYIYAEAMVNAVLYAREKYKGTGTPDYYCTPHALNIMLLARDMNGRRIYASKAELATALNVGEIVTAEQFEGKQRTTSESKKKNLLGIMVNMADYSLGCAKGGDVAHFTQFDIDFNQQKSLIETRVSGALTRVYSAIAIEEDVTDKE